MPYEDFCEKIQAIVDKVGGVKVKFFRKDGRHIAICSDGTRFLGNARSISVLVRWGSGHAAHTKM